jgi:hypothetical protein
MEGESIMEFIQFTVRFIVEGGIFMYVILAVWAFALAVAL